MAESELAPGTVVKWPMGVVRYHEALVLPGLTPAQTRAGFDLACRRWSEVCGLRFERVDRPDQAHIVATQGPIDGPWKVLAYSELPINATPATCCHQTYDVGESWAPELFAACACHELGHAIGLAHLPATGALMEPVLVLGRDRPQAPDVAEAVARYGPPVAPGPDWRSRGAAYRPHVVGPMADGLVHAARLLEAGHTLSGAIRQARRDAAVARNHYWDQVLAPLIAGLQPADQAAALRAIAAGLVD